MDENQDTNGDQTIPPNGNPQDPQGDQPTFYQRNKSTIKTFLAGVAFTVAGVLSYAGIGMYGDWRADNAASRSQLERTVDSGLAERNRGPPSGDAKGNLVQPEVVTADTKDAEAIVFFKRIRQTNYFIPRMDRVAIEDLLWRATDDIKDQLRTDNVNVPCLYKAATARRSRRGYNIITVDSAQSDNILKEYQRKIR